ncbi:MAG: glutamate--tRNA ligase, partial [Psittacicella sp.]
HAPNTPYVVRFKNPTEGSVKFHDLIRGDIEIQNSELDDMIILRTDKVPTYNFCVVIDDWDMAITHVIRGEDHINNTPRQINILKALGAPIPEYAHVSMVLGEDGQKFSKRHGAVNVMQYREDGFLPHAFLNYLLRLGWGYQNQEIFSLEEMINLFDVKNISHSSSAFSLDKLIWINHHYINTMDPKEVAKEYAWQLNKLNISYDKNIDLSHIVSVFAERSKTLKEMALSSKFIFTKELEYDEQAVKKHLRGVASEPLTLMKAKLEILESWEAPLIHKAIEEVTEELSIGMGKIGMPLRVAVTGLGQSPGIDLVIEIIGKDKTISRIQKALELIEERMKNS